MRLLLDTHAFIWWDSNPDKLSDHALRLCEDRGNSLVLSAASLWEIQIKLQLGKVEINRSLAGLVMEQQEKNGLEILPVNAAHIYELSSLPPIHKDPFDRLLVAQAKAEGLRLVSHDVMIRRYSIEVEW